MTGPTVVTRHLTRFNARRELRRLQKLQVHAALGELEARVELHTLDLTYADELRVRKEPRRRFKWAVVR